MKAGLGRYPGPAELAFNQSRLTTWLQCPREYLQTYVQDIVYTEAEALPLTLGTLAHKAFELAELNGATVAAPLVQAAVERAVEQREDDGASPDEVYKFGTVLEHALPLYEKKYLTDQPAVALATEQPFWFEFEDPTIGEPAVMLGTFDAIKLERGTLLNWEHKTVGTGVDYAEYVAQRHWHPQHIGYQLALELIAQSPEELASLGLAPDAVTAVGTAYQLMRRDPYPIRATASKTLEQRQDEWAARLFYRHTSTTAITQAQREAFMREVAFYMTRSSDNVRNLRACTWPGGTPRCVHYQRCIHGADVPHKQREWDYVDEIVRGGSQWDTDE